MTPFFPTSREFYLFEGLGKNSQSVDARWARFYRRTLAPRGKFPGCSATGPSHHANP
jgi:hypothetical protein